MLPDFHELTLKPHVLPVTIDGLLAGLVDGLQLVPDCADGGLAHVQVSGLAINGFAQNGISIDGGGSFFITDNYIGTDASGTEARPNGLHGMIGVRVPFEQSFELRVPRDLRGSFIRASTRHVQSNYITPIVSSSEFGPAIAVR